MFFYPWLEVLRLWAGIRFVSTNSESVQVLIVRNIVYKFFFFEGLYFTENFIWKTSKLKTSYDELLIINELRTSYRDNLINFAILKIAVLHWEVMI